MSLAAKLVIAWAIFVVVLGFVGALRSKDSDTTLWEEFKIWLFGLFLLSFGIAVIVVLILYLLGIIHIENDTGFPGI